MPAWRRNDACKWKKWKFYPGAMTFLITRILLSAVILLCLILFLKVLLMGHKADQPLTGCRKTLIRWAYKFSSFFILLLSMFMFTTWKHLAEEDVNYY